jgi:hypothetical protein
MTPQGRKRFLAWLEAPSGGSTRAIRLELITRLYFLRLYMPEKLAQAFDQQRIEAKTHIQRLENMHAALASEEIYNRMSLELRLKQLESVLEWLDECQELFQPR